MPISSRHRVPVRAGLAAKLLLAGALLLTAPGVSAQPSAGESSLEPERLVFLLQYIALDYGLAVQDEAIANPFEYQEMRTFSQRLVEQVDPLRALGASEQTCAGLGELERMIRETRPWAEVRTLANRLASALTSELNLLALPAVAPDLGRGRRFYISLCASCHGLRGRGDGRYAVGLEPPPTAFHEPRMNRVSPHQIYGAVKFGVEGTAMTSFEGKLAPERIWDIAFFIMTLRSGFSRHAPEQGLPFSLADLAQRSNEELLASASATGIDVHPAHVDYYRASPESAQQPPRLSEPPADPTRETESASVPPGSDLQVAMRLQSAFADVAEAASPSVVGVTGLIRRAEGAAPNAREGQGGWRVGSLEERLYPHFRPARTGSGFLVSAEGSILTAQRLLLVESGAPVDAVDVELHDGRHRIARIVGSEPTIDLAVLELEPSRRARPSELHPIRIGDSDAIRVGHWTIALGDPPGPGKTFVVGTLSSSPERQCYQEDLTATLMQTSLGVPVGGYGGPLLDIEGAVVGMMVPGPDGDLGGLVSSQAPLRFALPINLAMAIYEPLLLKGSRQSPWLGFSVLELRAAWEGAADELEASAWPPHGVYIDDVFEPSPAAAAGIRVGDSLTSIDGHPLHSVSDFQKWLYLSGIGRSIALEIFREGATIETRVTVEQRPAAVVPR